jgi:hypothetical protein
MSLPLIVTPSVVVATWRVSLFALIFALYSRESLLRLFRREFGNHPDIDRRLGSS